MKEEKHAAEETLEDLEELGEAKENETETADSNLEAAEQGMETEEADEASTMKQKLEAAESTLQETLSQMQRLQADFANYKKRTEKEKSEIYLYAGEKLVVELLGIVDNMERALEAGAQDSDSGLVQGIELVLKQLKELLGKHGVEEIQSLNEPFDMNLHHAVMQEESDAESNTIIEVFQKGYKLHQKVIRPAMVKVSR